MRMESALRRAGINDSAPTITPFSKERGVIFTFYTTRQVLTRGVKANVRVLRIHAHLLADARGKPRPFVVLSQCLAPRIPRYLAQQATRLAGHYATLRSPQRRYSPRQALH